jgi:hypothetical protein
MAEMAQQEDESDFDTVDELAEFFWVSPSSIRRAINKSHVRAFRKVARSESRAQNASDFSIRDPE